MENEKKDFASFSLNAKSLDAQVIKNTSEDIIAKNTSDVNEDLIFFYFL